LKKRIKTNKDKFPFKKLKKDLHWLDAVSDTGWLSKDQMDKQSPAKAVCSQMWIYKEDDKSITLFANYSYDDDGHIEFGEVITIPKVWM
jgi:hypothetical protein